MSAETEHRGPGRPRLSDDQKPTTRHVKLPSRLDDALCHAAIRAGMKVNQFIRLAVERALEDRET